MKYNYKDKNDMYRYGIYRIYNKRTKQNYIGKTYQSFARRWSKHKAMLHGNYHTNKLLQLAYNDGTDDDIELTILHICQSPDEITKYERMYIDKFKSMHYDGGYNMELPKKDIELDQGTDKENKKEDLPNLNMANRRKEKEKK